jgi:hypothetical protein
MLRLGLLLCLLAGHARAEEIAVAQYGNAVNAFPYAIALDENSSSRRGPISPR